MIKASLLLIIKIPKMKTKNRIITVGILVFTFLALVMCKKDAKISSLNSSQKEFNSTAFFRRLAKLSQKEVVMAVKKFKAQVSVQRGASLRTAELPEITLDSLTLDSAIWLIETTLNYTFDRIGAIDTFPLICDSLTLSTPYNASSGYLQSDDIVDIYDSYATYCANAAADDKPLKLLDLTTRVVGTTNVITSYALLNGGKNGFGFAPDCNPFDVSYSASWSTFYNCQFVNANDAPYLVTKRLNCLTQNGVGCFNVFSWAFLPCAGWTILTSPSSPGASSIYNNVASGCDNTILSGTQLNSYVSSIQGLGATYVSNMQISFPGIQMSGYSISADEVPLSGSTFHYWKVVYFACKYWCKDEPY